MDFLDPPVIYIFTGVGSGGARGACAPPLFCLGGQWYVCAPPLFTPHFNFSLELYVYIKLTNNYLAFFIYQLIILWTISINWHRWLLLNNHISKYNSFILVLYRRYINYVSVCPPTFWHLPTPLILHTQTHSSIHTVIYCLVMLASVRYIWPIHLLKRSSASASTLSVETSHFAQIRKCVW